MKKDWISLFGDVVLWTVAAIAIAMFATILVFTIVIAIHFCRI